MLPHQANRQEVLQVVEQRVLDPEELQRPDGPRTGSSHHQSRSIQSDAGQRVAGGDGPGQTRKTNILQWTSVFTKDV